jgi:two-component system, cell cycle sensor histidine kinase and response regulator CckA
VRFPRLPLRWWIVLGAVVAACVGAVSAWPYVRPLPRTPLRIGYEFDPPYHYRGADGRPHGMAVDIVKEAARRIGLPLDWTFFPGSSWTLVRDGHADLWPLLAVLPERKGFVHISAPYLTSDLYLLVRADLPSPPAGYDGEIGVPALPLIRRYLSLTFPKARPRPYETTQLVAQAVCQGEVSAGLVSVGAATAALRLPPDKCHERLRPVKQAIAPIGLGIGASLQYAWVADRLRREVDTMAADGTLERVLLPYSISSSAEAASAIDVAHTRALARAFARGLVATTIALAAVIGLGAALIRSNRRTLSAISARRELEAQLHAREHLEAVGRLAGGIAHDFNNVMTVIIGCCDLLLMDIPAKDPRRQPVEDIQSASDRAAALVRQLLTFSRRQIVRPARVSAHAVLTQLEPTLRQLLGDDISLEVSKEAGDDAILIDPGQLQEVVLNLSANAREAMPQGGRLTFRSGSVWLDGPSASPLELDPGAYVRVRVSDTGTGMDEDTRRHAFEPFYTTKPFGAGAGLGLASVYGVMKQAGGTASISSIRGAGTTFDLYFPPAATTTA